VLDRYARRFAFVSLTAGGGMIFCRVADLSGSATARTLRTATRLYYIHVGTCTYECLQEHAAVLGIGVVPSPCLLWLCFWPSPDSWDCAFFAVPIMLSIVPEVICDDWQGKQTG